MLKVCKIFLIEEDDSDQQLEMQQHSGGIVHQDHEQLELYP